MPFDIDKIDVNIFKKVALEMGLEWDDNATEATIDGEPIVRETIRQLLLPDSFEVKSTCVFPLGSSSNYSAIATTLFAAQEFIMIDIQGTESALVLDNLFFESFSFESNGVEPSLVHPKIQIGKDIKPLDKDGFQTRISCEVVVDGFFKLEVSLVGHFSVVGGMTGENSYLTENSVAILFPYLRSQITLLTAQPGISPLVIPAINITAFLQADEDF